MDSHAPVWQVGASAATDAKTSGSKTGEVRPLGRDGRAHRCRKQWLPGIAHSTGRATKAKGAGQTRLVGSKAREVETRQTANRGASRQGLANRRRWRAS